MERETILVIMDQGIGNMVMLTPTLRALRTLKPSSLVTVLCREPAAQVIRGWRVVNRVITKMDDSKYQYCFVTMWGREYAAKYVLRLAAQCENSYHVEALATNGHEADQQLNLVRGFGYHGGLPAPFCRTSKVELPWKRGDKIAILSDTTVPGVGWKRKRWPHYTALAKLLQAKGYAVALVGGEHEAQEYNATDWPAGVISLLGKYTIPQTAWIIKQATVFIGNDSGPAHIAGAVGTRTIAIFGATKIEKNRPLGSDITIVTQDLPCAPCQYTARWGKCDSWECVDGITPENVMAAVEQPAPVISMKDGMPKVAAVMIVKDEEANIKRCLDSIHNIVDDIIIVDTGSTDATMEIAKQYKKVQLFQHDWQGSFSEARNYSLKMAEEFSHAEWYIIIDADEELVSKSAGLLKPALARINTNPAINAMKCSILSSSPTGDARTQVERIFRAGSVYYKESVHNQPRYTGRPALSDVWLFHWGYNLSPDVMAKKYKRTEILLLKALEERPRDPAVIQYLIRNYRCQSRWLDILNLSQEFYQYIEANGHELEARLFIKPDQLIRADTISAYINIEDTWTALLLAEESLKLYPDNMDINFLCGSLHSMRGIYEKAIVRYLKYIQLRQLAAHGEMGIIQDTWGAQGAAYHNMAAAYMALGDLPNALMSAWLSTQLAPDIDMFQNALKSVFSQAVKEMSAEFAQLGVVYIEPKIQAA